MNYESRVREFDIRHPGKEELIFSIGATVDLSHPATFSVAEILHYQMKFSEAQRRELRQWIAGKHSIEGLSG